MSSFLIKKLDIIVFLKKLNFMKITAYRANSIDGCPKAMSSPILILWER